METKLFRPRKKICVFTVRRLTLIFGPDPKHFYGTFSRKLFEYPIFAFQCSFWCLRDHSVDKNELKVTLQMYKCILDAIQHQFSWDIFDFSSETGEQNSTKLDRKQDLKVLYQVCVFGPIGKTRWPPWPPDWLRHLPSLCFAGRSVNKNVRLGRILLKVAHCTQVHNMWPFGPLVFKYGSRCTIYIIAIQMYIATSKWNIAINEILQYIAISFSLAIPTP